MPCNCSETYDRIEIWERRIIEIPKIELDPPVGGCECIPPDESLSVKAEVVNQSPSPGQYALGPAEMKSMKFDPEPKCEGNCSRSYGTPSYDPKEETVQERHTEEIVLEVKVTRDCTNNSQSTCTFTQIEEVDIEEVILQKLTITTPITSDCKTQ